MPGRLFREKAAPAEAVDLLGFKFKLLSRHIIVRIELALQGNYNLGTSASED